MYGIIIIVCLYSLTRRKFILEGEKTNMNNFFKKSIAAVSAATMVGSLGLVPITASAATVWYSQDFTGTASTIMTSPSAQAQVKIASDDTHGEYLSYDFTGTNTNSRGASMDFTGVDVTAEDKYIIEFDQLMTPGNNQSTQMAIKGTDFKNSSGNINYGADSGYVLKLINSGGGSTSYKLNDTADVTIPSGEWCHYKLYVDKTQQLVSTTITSDSGTTIADKVATAYNGSGNVSGLYWLGGRYYPVQSIDNINVRAVADGDDFGTLGEEKLSSAEFTKQLNISIPQPAVDSSVDYPIEIKATGGYGGDLTDKVNVEWSIVGLDNEDGYVKFTSDGTKANVNVRNGVSNYYGYVKAVVSYGDEAETLITPYAIIGANSTSETQLVPKAGYPDSMDSYVDSLVGYEGTSKDINSQDLVLNNWSMYGSNSARTMKLVKDDDGTKSIEFASNGGGGSTVAVYQWADQTSQYIMKFRTKFTASMSFGVYANTPNNSNSNAEWAASFNGGSIVAGTETIEGVNANEWVDIVVSADPSVQKYSIAAYKTDGTLIGSASDIDMANNDSVQKYFCFMGTYPFYLNSFKAYKPSISSISVNSAEDVVKVPETGEEAKTVDLSAALADEDGTKITGAVNWSLADEYANVELTSTGAQTAVLKVSPGASGEIEVVASKDGKQASKKIQLTTSANVVAFTKSASSLTIPFTGEDAVTADFTAETRNGNGETIDGGTITYSLLAKDGVTETTVKGVTFENGKLTVAPGASPAIVYVKATNAEGLSTKVKVNIHGLSFAFGSQEPADGYTQVTDTVYTEKLGYGFMTTDGMTVNEDNVTADKAYRFKAAVPNGNYTVTVDTTSATMTSEVVESVSATTGISKSGSTFSVAVCDGVLDLTFLADSSVKSLSIAQAAAKSKLAKPTVYAIGDSTTNNTVYGACSWGNAVSGGKVIIPDTFGNFSNNGMAGRDSVSFYNQGRVETVLLNVCPGDYVTVNMGINSKEAGEAAAYYTLMSDYYVEGIIQRGAIPVIVTATPDGPVGSYVNTDYDSSTGKFTNNRGDGAKNNELRRIAQEKNLNKIELGQWGEDYFNSLTMDDVNAYNEANGTSYTSVLELVQSWYVDHNHYKEPLGIKFGEYILSQLESIANTSKAPDVTVTSIGDFTSGSGDCARAYKGEFTGNGITVSTITWTVKSQDGKNSIQKSGNLLSVSGNSTYVAGLIVTTDDLNKIGDVSADLK